MLVKPTDKSLRVLIQDIFQFTFISTFTSSGDFSGWFTTSICLVTGIVLISNKKTIKRFLLYLWVILLAGLVCSVPLKVMSSPGLGSRLLIAAGAVVGISAIFLVDWMSREKNKKIYICVYVLVSVYLAINTFGYMKTLQIHKEINQEDSYIMQEIAKKVQKYEEITKNKIQKIMIVQDKKASLGLGQENAKSRVTARGTALRWSIPSVVKLSLGDNRKIEVIYTVETQEQYEKMTQLHEQNWDSFNSEQIQLVGDTMYYCIY